MNVPEILFSLSRMCFDVLSIEQQRHRERREPVAQPNQGTGSGDRKRGLEELVRWRGLGGLQLNSTADT